MKHGVTVLCLRKSHIVLVAKRPGRLAFGDALSFE